MNNKFLDDILEAIQDIIDNAEDTLWIGINETVVDRLIHIYLENGGNRNILEEKFPGCL